MTDFISLLVRPEQFPLIFAGLVELFGDDIEREATFTINDKGEGFQLPVIEEALATLTPDERHTLATCDPSEEDAEKIAERSSGLRMANDMFSRWHVDNCLLGGESEGDMLGGEDDVL